MRKILGVVIPKYKSLREWNEIYFERLENSDFADKTISSKRSDLKKINKAFGNKSISGISSYEIDQFLKDIVKGGHNSAAYSAYVLLSDIFREAMIEGWIKSNPLDPIKPPPTPVKRARLLFEEWRMIFNASQVISQEYMHIALLVALVTGLRRSDIVKIRRTDIFDDHLHIIHNKDLNIAKREKREPRKTAIPLDIHCELIDLSLRDIVNYSRFPRYLISDQKLNPWNLTTGFQKIRDKIFPDKWEYPPTFHEVRSLSERIYRDQGVNTRVLLGHTSDKMTFKYNDLRGHDYQRLRL